MSPLNRSNRLLLTGVLCLSGCMQFGPDFAPQREAWSEGWNTAALQQASQVLLQPDARQWWEIFGDPVLEQLIALADAQNANVLIAGLQIMEARAQLGIAQSGRYPQSRIAGADALYQHRPARSSEGTLNNRAVARAVHSYGPIVFSSPGRRRRRVNPQRGAT